MNEGNPNEFATADDYGNIIIWNINTENKKIFGKMIRKFD